MAKDLDMPKEVERDLEDRGGIETLLEKIDDPRMEEMSQLHKSLSNPLRLKVLTLLAEQDLCVCLLKEILDIEDSKLSYHLSVLKDEGLIEGEREANFVIYRVTEKGRRYAP
ncbi:MAG: ArsR/SmtB family transcription factor [Candidatus Natronoplasma sp.]